MPAQYSLAALESPKTRRSDVRCKVSTDYWALTKPEVNVLILITTLAGFCLALH